MFDFLQGVVTTLTDQIKKYSSSNNTRQYMFDKLKDEFDFHYFAQQRFHNIFKNLDIT